MKKTILAVSLSFCLGVVFITGCSADQSDAGKAVSQNETAETSAVTRVREVSDSKKIEMELQMCREVVENAQSLEAVSISGENQNRGENVMDGITKTTYYRSGENEYHSDFIPMDGFLDGVPVWGSSFTTLKIGEQYYNYSPDGYVVAKETGYEDHFGKSSLTKEQNEKSYIKPWLLRFCWEDEKISHISTIESGENKAVRIQVSEPFYPDAEGENYTAEFFFQNGQFDRAELTASFGVPWETMAGDKGVDWNGVTVTERIKSTDSTYIQDFLEEMRKTALEDVNNKPE